MIPEILISRLRISFIFNNMLYIFYYSFISRVPGSKSISQKSFLETVFRGLKNCTSWIALGILELSGLSHLRVMEFAP